MIKLERTPKPTKLTVELQQELTEIFILTGKSVWNQDFIKKELLLFANNKCCYCETNITEESKYLEIDHFHHKNKYKHEVLEWSNLLPSCKMCNCTKKDHDTKTEPIINPCIDNPQEHLTLWNYRLKGCDKIGKLTIEVLNLNDQDRHIKKRWELGNAVIAKLEQLNELAEICCNNITNALTKKRLINGTKGLLKEGLPNSIYSATISSTIIHELEYESLKTKLIDLELWDDEISIYETEIKKIAFKLP